MSKKKISGRKQTPRRGSFLERKSLLVKISRLRKEFFGSPNALAALNKLAEFIKTRVPRFKKRKGGL